MFQEVWLVNPINKYTWEWLISILILAATELSFICDLWAYSIDCNVSFSRSLKCCSF
uniref:Uncharacterized protein n=1 Tax=Rhizophora mucronata TaxID=61149 RepID=A0A2P2N6Y4_RHIMU